MRSGNAAQDTEVSELSEVEATKLFDGICRRAMGVSAGDFLREWDAGHYAGVDVDSVPGLADVAAAVPLVRET